MADEIYVVTRMTPTTHRFDLSGKEQDDLWEKWKAALDEAGGENVVFLGRQDHQGNIIVNRFPSNDAWKKYGKTIWELQVSRYWTLENDLCTTYPKTGE